MKDEPGGQGQPSQSPFHVDKVDKFIVVEARRDPEIPEGKGRTCPQCRRTAWRESRYCWNCEYDFDRAALPRCHPKKLLIIAVSINLLVLLMVLVCANNGFHRRNPTPTGGGSSTTSILATAGTLTARLGASMSTKPKIDVGGIWAKRGSADVAETLRERQGRLAVPLVHVGTVQGNVITINTSAGLDLGALLAKPQDGAS